MHMRFQLWELSNFVHYISKALQLKHNIVIGMNPNYPTIGEIKANDPLASPEVSLIRKGTPKVEIP